jgi:membrane protein implicated in regulation of membrane protease activity
MRRHWKLWILAAVLLAAIAGAGKLVVLAVITLLLPVYGLLWMSIFLIGFIILASIVVPIGRSILENRESKPVAHDIPEEPRRAA